MTLGDWASAFGSEVVWEVVLTGFALIGAVLAGVLTVQGGLRSSAAQAAGTGLAAVLVVALGRIALRGWPPADPTALEQAGVTFAVLHLVAPLTIGPVALATLGLAAFAGAREAPRRWEATVAVIALALAVSGVVAWGGWASGDTMYAGARAVAYAVAGAVVAVACCAGGQGAGPVSAGAAGAVFPVVVAAGEASQRGLVWLILVGQAANVPPERWGTAVERMLALVHPEWVAAQVAVGIACGVAGVGVFAARGVRGQAAVAAVLGCALAWGVVLGSELGAERAQALAAVAPAD